MARKVLIVVGTRPNFIKITQFERAFNRYPGEFEYRLLHTGQHYDEAMSKVFFEQLKLKAPDYYLGIESGHPALQVGEIIRELSKVLLEWRPDVMIVPGDVNSTLAAAIAGNKVGIPLAHLEAGLRSRDRSMPEEINRILTDEITDLFFITEQSGWDHLIADGKQEDQLFFVGNTMIDTLVAFDKEIQASPILETLGVQPQEFALMTMHRPANVDFEEQLHKLIHLIGFITERFPLVFPIHPRTTQRLKDFGLWEGFQQIPNLILSGPMDYLSFQKLIADCKFLVTDSGGIQEETTFRQVPCLTLRPNTERPSTLELGTNLLIDFDLEVLEKHITDILNGTFKKGQIPPLWDGSATDRIVEVLRELI